MDGDSLALEGNDRVGQWTMVKLTSESWVAGGTVDQGTEDSSDTDTGTSETNSGETSSLHLASSQDGSGRRLSDDTARLDGCPDGGSEGIAGLVEEESIATTNWLGSSAAHDGAGDASCGRPRWISTMSLLYEE